MPASEELLKIVDEHRVKSSTIPAICVGAYALARPGRDEQRWIVEDAKSFFLKTNRRFGSERVAIGMNNSGFNEWDCFGLIESEVGCALRAAYINKTKGQAGWRFFNDRKPVFPEVNHKDVLIIEGLRPKLVEAALHHQRKVIFIADLHFLAILKRSPEYRKICAGIKDDPNLTVVPSLSAIKFV